MRWERLFDDLEAQVAAAEAVEWHEEVSERTRYEQGRLTLRDRLRAALGADLALGVGPLVVCGRLLRVAADALLVEDLRGQVVVPLAAVDWVRGLQRAASPDPEGPPRLSLTLRAVLRDLARDRMSVSVTIGSADVPVRGRVQAVGADAFDLLELDPTDPHDVDHRAHRSRLVAVAAVRALRVD